MNIIVLGTLILIIFIAYLFIQYSIKEKNKKLIESVTQLNRGTKSEIDLVLKLLKYGIPNQNIFHDLYVKRYNNTYSQIDLVVLTNIGIIAFEVKDYSGWIFGTGYKHQWTKVLAYGKRKYKFYNPILQNNQHIKELKRLSPQFTKVPYFSIIVFYGDCQLKDITFIPEGTFIVKHNRILDVLNLILKTNNPINYIDKPEIISLLKTAVQNGSNTAIVQKHTENINDSLGRSKIFD